MRRFHPPPTFRHPAPAAPVLCSQRDDVCIRLLHRDAQWVLLHVVQGMLVRPPLQEQADLAEGGGASRGRPWAGPGR